MLYLSISCSYASAEHKEVKGKLGTAAASLYAVAMPADPLPSIAQADRLTEMLRRAGALEDAAVSEVAVENSRATLLSRIVRLRLTYDRRDVDAPGSLILKTGLPERAAHGVEAARNEVAFYNDVASVIPALPVLRCFEAHCDAETNAWHLVLEDLSDTHFVLSPWPLPPTTEQCLRVVEARARLHAAWWGDARLGTSVGIWRNETAWRELMIRLRDAVQRFSDRLGERLSPQRRHLYEQFLAAAPRLSARYRVRRNATIVQGDAHPWNCFLPCDGGGDVRLFDWDAWRVDLGVSDLAHMMAVQWYPEQRRQMEQHVLDHYHATLLAHGVDGYDRAALAEDYRFCTLAQIAWPVWQAAFDIPPSIWWNNFERVMLAIDDLGCRDLLTG